MVKPHLRGDATDSAPLLLRSLAVLLDVTGRLLTKSSPPAAIFCCRRVFTLLEHGHGIIDYRGDSDLFRVVSQPFSSRLRFGDDGVDRPQQSGHLGERLLVGYSYALSRNSGICAGSEISTCQRSGR